MSDVSRSGLPRSTTAESPPPVPAVVGLQPPLRLEVGDAVQVSRVIQHQVVPKTRMHSGGWGRPGRRHDVQSAAPPARTANPVPSQVRGTLAGRSVCRRQPDPAHGRGGTGTPSAGSAGRRSAGRPPSRRPGRRLRRESEGRRRTWRTPGGDEASLRDRRGFRLVETHRLASGARLFVVSPTTTTRQLDRAARGSAAKLWDGIYFNQSPALADYPVFTMIVKRGQAVQFATIC